MSSYTTEEQFLAVETEPTAVCRTATGGESFSAMCNTTVSKTGRMTVMSISVNFGQCISKKVKNYRVEIEASARADKKDLANLC